MTQEKQIHEIAEKAIQTSISECRPVVIEDVDGMETFFIRRAAGFECNEYLTKYHGRGCVVVCVTLG